MPPTPEQLIINPATIDVKTPQVQTQIVQAPQYVEGEVSMPSPNQWIGQIDYGLDWYALGSKAFGVAGNIYEDLQKYGLRRRREYAQDDMNKIQQISVEKPDPAFNDYQLEDFYKQQSRKLKESTRQALVRQGFSDDNINKIMPEQGVTSFDPSDLSLPATDMDSLLQFTRYYDLTNQEFSNQVTKYNQINWENSISAYNESSKRGFGSIDGRTPVEVKQEYDYRFTEMQDNVNNKVDRQNILNFYKGKSDYLVSLNSSIKNETDKVLDNVDSQVVLLYEQLTDGELTPDEYTTKLDTLYAKADKQIYALASIDPTVNPVKPVEERKQERLNRNPNNSFDYNLSRLERIDEELSNISYGIANAQNNNDWKTVEDFTTLQKNLVNEKLNLIYETYSGTNPVFLNKENQSRFASLSKTYETLAQQEATKKEQLILTKAVEKGVLNYEVWQQKFNGLYSQLANYRQVNKTKGPPTQSLFLELIGKTEDSLDPVEQAFYKVLPVDNNPTTNRLNLVDDSKVQEVLWSDVQKEFLKTYGISFGEDGRVVAPYQVQRKIYEHTISAKQNTKEAARGTANAQTMLREKGDASTYAEQVATNPASASREQVREYTGKLFKDIMSNRKVSPVTWAGVFKPGFDEKAAGEMSFYLRDPQGRERFLEAVFSNAESVNREDLARWSKTSAQTALSNNDIATRDDVMKTSRFIGWVSRNVPSGFDIAGKEKSKLDPKVLLQNYEKFEQDYELSLRKLRQADGVEGSKKMATMLEAARYLATNGRIGTFGSVQGITEQYPNFQATQDLWAAHLGKDYWWDANQITDLIANSEEGFDLISPIILATMGSPTDTPPEQIVEIAKQYSDMMGVRVVTTLNSAGKKQTVISNDAFHYTDSSTSNLNPVGAETNYVLSPALRTQQTLESVAYNSLPSHVIKNGKPYIPTTDDEKEKIQPHNKETMLGYVAAAMPGTSTVYDVQGSTELMGVLDPLFKAYDQNLTVEQRKQLVLNDPKIKEWIFIAQKDNRETPGTIAQSRINFLMSTLDKPQLTAATMVEIGLNSASHITETEPAKLALQRVWRPLGSYRVEFLRNSENKNEVDNVFQPSSFTFNDGDLEVGQRNIVEPIAIYNPTTNQRVNLNPFPPANIGVNPKLEKPLAREGYSWMQDHKNEVWDFIDMKGEIVPNVTISEKYSDMGIMSSTQSELVYDSVNKNFNYINRSLTFGSGAREGSPRISELPRKVMPYRQKKAAEIKELPDFKNKFNTVDSTNSSVNTTNKPEVMTNENKQVSPGAVSDKQSDIWWQILADKEGAGEGLKLQAYQDQGGVWTVGYGTTRYSDGTPVKQGDTVTEEEAVDMANYKIYNDIIPTLEKRIPTWNDMNENQQAAIVSFAYNYGEYFYGKPNFETITKALSNKESFTNVPTALKLYNKGLNKKTGQKEVQGGLVKRREKEGQLWVQGTELSKKFDERNLKYLKNEYQTFDLEIGQIPKDELDTMYNAIVSRVKARVLFEKYSKEIEQKLGRPLDGSDDKLFMQLNKDHPDLAKAEEDARKTKKELMRTKFFINTRENPQRDSKGNWNYNNPLIFYEQRVNELMSNLNRIHNPSKA